VTYHLFNYHLRKQQWDQAEKLLEPLARADQDQAGRALAAISPRPARGDFEAATKYARNVVQNMPEFGQSWIALGAVLQITGQTDEALSKYLAGAGAHQQQPEAFRGIIDCYTRWAGLAEAKSYIDRARKPCRRTSSSRSWKLTSTWLLAIRPSDRAARRSAEEEPGQARRGAWPSDARISRPRAYKVSK
jgi:tetratricopeptide (TPR) repeat protein